MRFSYSLQFYELSLLNGVCVICATVSVSPSLPFPQQEGCALISFTLEWLTEGNANTDWRLLAWSNFHLQVLQRNWTKLACPEVWGTTEVTHCSVLEQYQFVFNVLDWSVILKPVNYLRTHGTYPYALSILTEQVCKGINGLIPGEKAVLIV